MPYYNNDTVFQTQAHALEGCYTVDRLKPLAKMICDGIPTRKAELIDAIIGAMEGEKIKGVFERLDRIGQLIVAEAVFAPDGKVDFRKINAKYQSSSGTRQGSGDMDGGDLLDLFIYNRQVPDDMRDRLKTFVPMPKPDRVKYVNKLPNSIESNFKGEPGLPLEIRKTAPAVLHNLEVVLRLIDGGKLRVSSQTGRPTSATVKNLAKRLHEGDWYNAPDVLAEVGAIQAFAWPLIVRAAGLARADGSSLKLTKNGYKALDGNRPQVIKSAWKKWAKNKVIDEFSRINEIKGQKSSRGRTLAAPSKRRPFINEALSQCLPGRWVKVEELIRFMQSTGLDFQVARYPWKLYVGDSHYGHLDGYGSESIISSRYLLAFLFEYAATLGLIDVAFTHPAGALGDFDHLYGAYDLEYLSRYDGLKYFRLNPLGAYVLGLSDRFDPPAFKPRPVLTVLPNHEIVITDAVSLSPADKLFLNKIGQKASSSLWRLTLATLLAAAQGGTDSKQVRAFLESRSSQPLPETVIQLLNDAAGRSTRLSYRGRAHLIACKDPVLVQLISSDRKASKLCRAAAGEYIVVLPGKEKEFIKTVAAMGYIVPQFREQI
ncbi:hypothetical protein JY97_14440 [Alkalispirochaeta odontotermitis]|nr:hypothetical protein JY97_14440 [Alkalispirochaeta odontotermitis]CAB1083039.1 hypothetical protein D1AOALGA4SA_10625 [Olavius algarvensis Delta 1 endosymbiont]